MQITVTVNGSAFTGDVEPRLLLIHFLRDQLGLTGSHWGCDTSNCGACVVWLDETPVKSYGPMLVTVQAFVPPVGLIDVTTLPLSSTATQRLTLGQDTPCK